MGKKEASAKYRHWIYLLFFGLTWLLFLTDTGKTIDHNITLDIYNCFDSGIITGFFILITKYTLGSFVGVLLAYVYMAYKKDRQAILIASILFIVMSILYIALNTYIGRLRPFENFGFVKQLVDSTWMWEFSFPSGHSAFAFFIVHFLTNHYKFSAKIKLLLYLLAFLVALSRVYLGVHYVLDVTAGSLLGLFFGEIGLRYLKKE